MAVIIVVDDDASVLEIVCTALSRAGHEVVASTTGEEAIRIAPIVRPALLLLDLKLQDVDGLTVFARVRPNLPSVIGVIMTGFGSLPHALESGRKGIAEYIAKPFELDELVTIIDGVLAMHRTPPLPQPRAVTATVAEPFDGMIGESAIMRDVFQAIVRTASLEHPVLICGDTGTGKELVARSLHRRSTRHRGPFVDVNCSAVPTTLFEAEFFGHERGAFTDAKEAKRGLFERAHGGTLFLDEVGELPLEAQAKLLRVIDQREILRLGGRHPIAIDVRILSATNVDLVAAVGQGSFRRDLFWRLNGMTLRVPPVRDRNGDVALLLDWFFDQVRAEFGRPGMALSADARRALLAHIWPGNVREIEYVLRAAVLSARNQTVERADLTLDVAVAPHAPLDVSRPERTSLRQGLADTDQRLEREWIRQALSHADGNQTEAARQLGISPRTLYTKMRRHTLRRR